MTTADVRRRLLGAGFIPTPCVGKKPVIKGWQTLLDPTGAEVERWNVIAPAAANTGILARNTPTLDIDILDPDAAAAVEQLVKDRFEELGPVLVRIGFWPKRAIMFRTDTPFPKITINFVVAEGAPGEKLELLADGQQFVAFGTHPDTGKPYSRHGGAPGEVRREDLPYIHADEAQALVDDAAALLVERFGYRRETATQGNRAPDGPAVGWIPNLLDHDELVAYAMKMLVAGMHDGSLVNFLRDGVKSLQGVDEDRRRRRLEEIPGIVSSARRKLDQAAEEKKAESRAPGGTGT
jgi:hypothetical protein